MTSSRKQTSFCSSGSNVFSTNNWNYLIITVDFDGSIDMYNQQEDSDDKQQPNDLLSIGSGKLQFPPVNVLQLQGLFGGNFDGDLVSNGLIFSDHFILHDNFFSPTGNRMMSDFGHGCCRLPKFKTAVCVPFVQPTLP